MLVIYKNRLNIINYLWYIINYILISKLFLKVGIIKLNFFIYQILKNKLIMSYYYNHYNYFYIFY